MGLNDVIFNLSQNENGPHPPKVNKVLVTAFTKHLILQGMESRSPLVDELGQHVLSTHNILTPVHYAILLGFSHSPPPVLAADNYDEENGTFLISALCTRQALFHLLSVSYLLTFPIREGKFCPRSLLSLFIDILSIISVS